MLNINTWILNEHISINKYGYNNCRIYEQMNLLNVYISVSK